MHAQAPHERKGPDPLAGGTEAGIAMNSDENTTIPSHAVQCFRALAAAATDPNLCGSDVACLAVILERFNRAKGSAWPSVNGIARDAHIHRNNVIRAIPRLEAAGYLVVDRRGVGRSNHYRPTFKTGTANGASTACGTSTANGAQLVPPAVLELVPPAVPEPIYRTYPKNLSTNSRSTHACAPTAEETVGTGTSPANEAKGLGVGIPVAKRLRAIGIRVTALDPTLLALCSENFTPEEIALMAAEKVLRKMQLFGDSDAHPELPELLASGATQQKMLLTMDQYAGIQAAAAGIGIAYIAKALRGRRQDAIDKQSSSRLVKGGARRPSATDNFSGKNYIGTPIDQLPPEFREAVEKAMALEVNHGH